MKKIALCEQSLIYHVFSIKPQTISRLILPWNLHKQYHSPHCLQTFSALTIFVLKFTMFYPYQTADKLHNPSILWTKCYGRVGRVVTVLLSSLAMFFSMAVKTNRILHYKARSRKIYHVLPI